ncbi:MAG: gamma-glutamyltransferase [Saprospiraceae bacterium]
MGIFDRIVVHFSSDFKLIVSFMIRKLPFLIITLLILQCHSSLQVTDYWGSIQKKAVATKSMVVSGHPLASRVGIQILKDGGNAVDAAIAIQLALAVVYPRAGNIGGGGFLIYRSAIGEINSLDYREKAPAAAYRDMYLDTLGIPTRQSIEGHLASGIPGTIDGLFTAHKKYGRLPFDLLIAPAIKLALEGFQITKDEAERLNSGRTIFIKYNTINAFIKDEPWKQGDLLVQKDLAWTLSQIKVKGRDGFYKGAVAEKIIAEMKQGGGIITLADLDGYASKWRTPVTAAYKDYRIISMPPPSSGGIALAQLLKMVEPYPLATWGFRDPRSIHLMVEAERRVYADRSQYLGDSDFYNVPKDSLLDPKYIKFRMKDFDSTTATKSNSLYAGNFKLAIEHFETTHLSVVDKEGNAVGVTYTLNGNFGSKVVVDGAGFFLNNEMDDFSSKPGVPNMFGLIGAEANSIAPGKRMLSSMTPTIVEKNGQLSMVIGSPGGSTIITSVFQVFLDVAEWNMTMSQAVAASRFHHQWLPDEIMIESKSFGDDLQIKLKTMGHTLRDIRSIGLVDAIMKMPDGKLEGGADPRGDDDAEGW